MKAYAHRESKRVLVFLAVGTLNVAAAYLVYAALVELGWHYNLALAISYTSSGVLGYVLHRGSTFADRKHVRQGFGKYAVSNSVVFVANLVLLDWIVAHGWLAPLSAQGIAMGIATLLGYLLQTHWVFRSRHHEPIDKAQPVSRRDAA